MCGKNCFSKNEAEAAIKKAKKRKQYRAEKRCYYCEPCNSWHLTSKDEDTISLYQEVKLRFFKKWKRLLTT